MLTSAAKRICIKANMVKGKVFQIPVSPVALNFKVRTTEETAVLFTIKGTSLVFVKALAVVLDPPYSN